MIVKVIISNLNSSTLPYVATIQPLSIKSGDGAILVSVMSNAVPAAGNTATNFECGQLVARASILFSFYSYILSRYYVQARLNYRLQK